jgi:hypothetical protein
MHPVRSDQKSFPPQTSHSAYRETSRNIGVYYPAVVADIFDGYRLAGAWDEMFAAPGEPRPPYDGLVSVLQPVDPAEL